LVYKTMPSRSSRGRSRSSGRRGRLGVHTRLTFGRHVDRTYGEVLRTEPSYVEWALSVPRPQGDLRHFVAWLRLVMEVDEDEEGAWSDSELFDEEEEEEEEEEEDYSHHSAGHQIQALENQRRQRGSADMLKALIEQLPRVPFSANLFSGTPHPESCPICMEDFSAWEPGQPSEIVITPCLHTFHVGCISGWLGRRHDCPSCRWDIRDSGEQQAMSSSSSGLRRRLSSNLIEVSDDEG